jgi:2-desacetyl-2-hydroxyethyl bacteriochlorophyllide A dehydrogenase
MKAAVLHAPGTMKVVDIPTPTCGPTDVIVKTVRSGICGTDLTFLALGGEAIGMAADSEFGHESAGYITEVGDQVKDLTRGMRVFVHPGAYSPLGLAGAMSMGGFSEFIKVHDAKLNHNLYSLPESMTYDAAALIEPYAVAARGKNVANAKAGDNVVVYGVGAIGIMCIDSLCVQGIRPVAIVRNEIKRELLERMGAIVCNIKEVNIVDFLTETFGTAKSRMGYPVPDVDIIVDCAGPPDIMADLLKIGKSGTRLSIVGVCTEPVTVPLMSIMSSEVIIQGSCAYDDKDIREAIDNLSSEKFPLSDIITHHYKLEQIQEAMAMAGDRTKAIKVLIDME